MKIEESLSIKPFDIHTIVDPLKINFDKLFAKYNTKITRIN
jgi:hypothetical protein